MASNIQYGTPELWGLPPNVADTIGKFLPELDHMRAGVAVQPLSTNIIDAYDRRMGRTEKSLNRILTLLNAPSKTEQSWLEDAGFHSDGLEPKLSKVLLHHVQAQFIKNILGQEWAGQTTTNLLDLLTAQDRDALTLLRLLPGKVCTREDGTRDDTNNHKLARLLAGASDEHCFDPISNPRRAAPQEGAQEPPLGLLEIFNGVMQGLTTGITMLTSMLTINVDDADANAKEVAFSKSLFEQFEINSAPIDDQFRVVFEELMRLNSQLNKSGPHQAYSMSQNRVVEAVDAYLYMHLNDLHKAEDLQATWNKIPVKLLKEYALSFGVMILRLGAKNREENMLPIIRHYFQNAMPLTEETPIKKALRQIATFFLPTEENQ